MKQKLMGCFKGFETAVTVINGILLILIVTMIMVQVVARKLGISLAGTEELARFSYVIYTFLAWPIAGLYGTNISITMLLDKLSSKIRLVFLVIFQIAMAAFTSVAGYSAWLQMLNQTGVRAASNRWFMMEWLYMIVFGCLIICTIFNIVRAIYLITGDMVYVTMEEEAIALIEQDAVQLEHGEESI